MIPPLHHRPVDSVSKPKTSFFQNLGEKALSETFEAWWSTTTRWYGRRKSRNPDLSESEVVVDPLDMIQGPKCAVVNSLYKDNGFADCDWQG